MKIKYLLRVLSLLVLVASIVPLNHAALAAPPLPPVDMFQLPWEQGLAWVALDGFDNGSDRGLGSPHNYLNGGAIDFAPRSNMVRGENTSSFWVTAAAAGTVVETSKCHLKIVHSNGWLTEYQHLANFQVKLGNVVARNQKLAVIANASSQPVCPGSEPPDIPHLHFALRPNMVGATFAGWEFKYSSFWNSTTFTRNGVTLGLFKPLLNAPDSQPTPTPATQPTATHTPNLTPSSTPTPTMSPTPTLFGPYISTEVNPPNINVGESTFVTVKLNNVPVDGFTSVEITCPYDTSLFAVSNVIVAPLFGADAVTAINGPQNGKFIVAIAGSNGNKATTSGTVFTFSITGFKIGQAYLGCEARVSKGDNVLTQIPSAHAYLTVLGNTPTPNVTQSPAPSTPTISPTTCNHAEMTGYVNVPPGTMMPPGATFTQSWGLRNIGWCVWTPDYQLIFFGGEQMGAPLSINIPYDVAPSQLIILSVNFTAPLTNGPHTSLWKLRDASGAQFGVGASANDPLVLDIMVSGPTVTPGGLTPTAIPTATSSDWLTFTNSKYGFEFKYPPQGQILSGNTDNFARVDLPIVQGTNLGEKYLEVVVAENVNPCQSPLPTPNPSETITINGITFLKQTGEDAGAGNIYQWVAYSTRRDNACVSLDFILHSHNPDVYPTPPPVFDFAAESAVFGQIVSTYAWLTLSTATPTAAQTPTPIESPTPTATQTSMPTASPTAMSGAILTGQVIAVKIVTVRLYDPDENFVAAVNANPDGTFRFDVAARTYTIVATANGFLRIQGSITLAEGDARAMPVIALLAGDIDDNNEIDQFDAMTIGFNYNTAFPEGADLNNDGIINILDLELLAKNYRKTGPVVWE